MFRSCSVAPFAFTSALLISLALAGCGGSSPTNIVTNPVATTPVSVPVPTPTPLPAQNGLTATISSPSPDFSGQPTLNLTHGSAGKSVNDTQYSISATYSNLGQNITFQLTFAKTGEIQVGDVFALTPTSASTSEYSETFSSRSAWKADSGSVRVDSITSDGVYKVSLLDVHYSPETSSSAKGTFVLNGTDNLVFQVTYGVFIPGPPDAPVGSLR